MKLLLFFSSLLLASARAQYFSDGWKPGDKVTQETPAASAPTAKASLGTNPNQAPVQHNSIWELLDFSKVLLSEPAVQLFSKFGVNITERMAAMAETPWDDRIPLITDTNYHDMIVNETFTSEEEEKNRVWAIMM
jgi:hypothetical protein